MTVEFTGVLQNLVDPFFRKPGYFVYIEIGKVLAVAVTFVQNRRPAQAGLRTLEYQELELSSVIPDRHAPFFVMVFDIGQAGLAGPGAALYFFAH